MIEKDLDTRFQEAFEIASNMTQASLPQDVQLRLYAFTSRPLLDLRITINQNILI